MEKKVSKLPEGLIPNGTIILGYVGSHSHGTYIAPTDPDAIDDIDMMGVCVLPDEQYHGLCRNPVLRDKRGRMNNEQQEVQEGQWDIVVYEVRKYFNLLLKQNPNVLGLLWLEENLYVKMTSAGRLIVENRDIFTSKEAFHSFAGYANEQLHKMTHMAFKGYMGDKRKRLVERFGFDCKNAAHLIRLLRMCTEYLTDGKLRVMRPDARAIMGIKNGEWSLDRVKEESERLFTLAREAYVRSSLPAEPNYEKAEELLLRVTEMAYRSHTEG